MSSPSTRYLQRRSTVSFDVEVFIGTIMLIAAIVTPLLVPFHSKAGDWWQAVICAARNACERLGAAITSFVNRIPRI